MEGVWETTEGAPFLLFAIPDRANETNHFEIGLPNMASLVLTHELDGEVPGLLEVPAEERPPVGIVFWSFRVMLAIGTLMIGFALVGAWLRWKGRLFDAPRFHKGLTWMIPTPFIAVLAGWFVTEVGRSPWLLYGMMDYAASVTPSLSGGTALFSLIGYIAVYSVVFAAGVYYLVRIVRAGPEPTDTIQEPQHAKRPLSAADTPLHDNAATGARS